MCSHIDQRTQIGDKSVQAHGRSQYVYQVYFVGQSDIRDYYQASVFPESPDGFDAWASSLKGSCMQRETHDPKKGQDTYLISCFRQSIPQLVTEILSPVSVRH